MNFIAKQIFYRFTQKWEKRRDKEHFFLPLPATEFNSRLFASGIRKK
jgi:hypothetical protein